MHDTDTASQGLARVPHEVEHPGTREPVSALRPVAVHPHLDMRQETRRILDLVDDDRRLEALQEELRLLKRESSLKGIVEGEVVSSRLGYVLE